MDIFKLVGSVFVDTDQANESLKKTDEKAGGLGKTLMNGVKSAGKFAVGIGTAAAGASTALIGLASKASDSLDKIQKGAQQMDISYEAYQKLSYACDRSGASIEEMSKAVQNITNDMAEMDTSKFDELGVSITDVDGNLRSTEDVLMDSLMALADMEDATQRNALANDLFGKSYSDMLPLLNSGSDGIKEMMQSCEDLGLVMSDEAVDAGAQFGDMLSDVKDSFGAVVTQIGAQVFPIIQELLGWVMDNMPAIQSAIGKVVDFIAAAIPVVIEVFKTIEPIVKGVFDGIAWAWENVLKPVINAIVYLIDGSFKEDFINAFTTIKDKVVDLFDKLKEGIKTPINAIIGFINKMVGGVTEGINAVIRSLNKLKIDVPGWITDMTGVSSFGFNLSELSAPQIPELAEGGVLEKGQVGLLEGNGAEAVVPLDKNEKWISKVAQDMNAASNNNGIIDKLEELIAKVESLNITEIVQVVPDQDGIFEIVREKSIENADLGRPGIVTT